MGGEVTPASHSQPSFPSVPLEDGPGILELRKLREDLARQQNLERLTQGRGIPSGGDKPQHAQGSRLYTLPDTAHALLRNRMPFPSDGAGG